MNAPFASPLETKPVAKVLADAERDVRRRKRRNRLLLALAATILIATIGTLWLRGGDPTITYATRPITRGDLVVTVTATGSLNPVNQVEVSSELSGMVRSVIADYNDPVRKGDVLAELSTDNLDLEVNAARARVASARAGVAEADATLSESRRARDRAAVLVERKVAASQTLEAARAAFERATAAVASATAAVAVAEADLAAAETRLGKARILSPIDGVVLSRTVEPGQTVAASLQAPQLFTIAEDLRRMELRVDVDEADVGRVAPGQSATFTVDAYPGRSFPARIRTIRYASETVQGVVTYKAILDVDNADLSLRPGMTATADVVVQETKDALLAPNAALRWAPEPEADGRAASGGLLSRMIPRPPRSQAPAEQDGRTLFMMKDGGPVAVPVVPGGTDGRNTVVSGPVAETDSVIVDATVHP